jgi:hypothetical protein
MRCVVYHRLEMHTTFWHGWQDIVISKCIFGCIELERRGLERTVADCLMLGLFESVVSGREI